MARTYVSRLGTCIKDDCESQRWTGGFCRKHYTHRDKPAGEPGNYSSQGVCIEKQCQKKRHARGRCSFHYYHYNNEHRAANLANLEAKQIEDAEDYWQFVKARLNL